MSSTEGNLLCTDDMEFMGSSCLVHQKQKLSRYTDCVKSNSDYLVFTMHKIGLTVYILVYVDDILVVLIISWSLFLNVFH